MDPNNIEGWKQNIIGTNQQIDDWRDRNNQLEAQGLDAQHQALDAIKADAETRAKILANLSHMEQKVLFGNSANDLLKPPGEPGNILDNIDKIASDIASGKEIDRAKLAAIGKYYGDTVSGKVLPPDKMPQPGDADKGVWAETLKSTFNEVATCTNGEGGASWKGVAVRTGLAILTGGFSEVPLSVGAMKDYVDKGGNSVVGGFVAGAEAVVVGEVAGAAMGLAGKAAAVGGKVVGELAGEAGAAISKAAAGGSTVAQTMVNGAAAVSKVAGSVSTNILKPIASLATDVKTVLTTELGAPASAAEGAAAAASKAESAAAAASKAESAAAAVSKAESAAASAESEAAAAASKAESAAAAASKAESAAASAESEAAAAAGKSEGEAASAAAKTEGEGAAAAGKAEGEASSAASKTEGEAGARSKAEGATPPDGKQKHTYANSPGEDVTPHMAGMPEGNISQAQRIADKHNAQILVRPTNPESVELLASHRGVPKPCSVKNKTISKLDLKLGAKPKDIGKVGHFDPGTKPPPQGSMTNEEYSDLTKRFDQRKEEFIKQDQVLSKNSNIEIRDKVVYDKATGRPFVGDHDIYDIVGADGKPLPPDVKAQILKELEQPPFSAQHPGHMDWDYSNADPNVPAGAPEGTISDFQQAQGIDTKILESHSVGGEPLISFGPGRSPQASYFVGRR